jgi:hypothetical protein
VLDALGLAQHERIAAEAALNEIAVRFTSLAAQKPIDRSR